MNRRDAIQYITVMLGGSIVGANNFLSGCKSADNKALFSAEDIAYLDEIADTILPETDTPGAKAAKTGLFMSIMVAECYDEKEQQIFLKGMENINHLSNKSFDDVFIKCSSEERHHLLLQLDNEQKQYMAAKKLNEPTHYFRMMKELVLLGYFTSEIGYTKAKRYLRVPGRYEGCVPYTKGDKAIV